jgi:glycosyltransferase involved in cell wall biosynthesis
MVRAAARDADVVLSNGILALPALTLARPAAPVAWLVHDVVHRRDWRLLLRAVRRGVDLAVAVSEAVATPLRAQGLRVEVVPNGTVWPVEPAPLDHDEPPVVGCAALLTSWKGQDVLLDAVAGIDRDVVVELAGGRFPKDEPYVDALHERAAAPDLAGRVRFLGRVDDLSARMRTWSVAVLPSVDPEAAPLSLVEYMALGIPVVATDHGGTPEVLGHAGLLVPPRDAAALRDAIVRLLDDRGLREACASAGPAQVEAGLTLTHQLDRMAAVLGSLVNASKR